MTRRRVIFYNPADGMLYMTPEFNGDKSEYAARGGSLDSCDKDWHEIRQHFDGVTTITEFVYANIVAQSAYHSCLGDEVLPIEEVGESAISCDERIYLSKEAKDRYLYLLYKLDWANKRGYNINDYDEEHGFDGEAWVCFEEFCETELKDEEYMQHLLCVKDFNSSFLKSVEQFGAENLEFVFKAAHLAGMLEEAETIAVHDWDDLVSSVIRYLNWYLEESKDDYPDFFEALEQRLVSEFPNCKE